MDEPEVQQAEAPQQTQDYEAVLQAAAARAAPQQQQEQAQER